MMTHLEKKTPPARRDQSAFAVHSGSRQWQDIAGAVSLDRRLGGSRHSGQLFLALFLTLLLLLVLLLGLAVSPVRAQVYKITDEENGVVFTDRPESVTGDGQNSVERVDIPVTNTTAPVQAQPKARTRAQDAGASNKTSELASPTVTIRSPAPETTIAMGPGNFTVSASATPPLERGESLLLTIDGQPVGTEQQSSSWSIEGALRGPHDLVVLRKSRTGKTMATSEPVRVYVLRPSIIGR